MDIAGVYDMRSPDGPVRAVGHVAEEALEKLAVVNPTLSAWHTYYLAASGELGWIHDHRQRRIISVGTDHSRGNVIVHGDKLVILYNGRLLILRLHPSFRE